MATPACVRAPGSESAFQRDSGFWVRAAKARQGPARCILSPTACSRRVQQGPAQWALIQATSGPFEAAPAHTARRRATGRRLSYWTWARMAVEAVKYKDIHFFIAALQYICYARATTSFYQKFPCLQKRGAESQRMLWRVFCLLVQRETQGHYPLQGYFRKLWGIFRLVT